MSDRDSNGSGLGAALLGGAAVAGGVGLHRYLGRGGSVASKLRRATAPHGRANVHLPGQSLTTPTHAEKSMVPLRDHAATTVETSGPRGFFDKNHTTNVADKKMKPVAGKKKPYVINSDENAKAMAPSLNATPKQRPEGWVNPMTAAPNRSAGQNTPLNKKGKPVSAKKVEDALDPANQADPTAATAAPPMKPISKANQDAARKQGAKQAMVALGLLG